jgi:hypothetical protein
LTLDDLISEKFSPINHQRARKSLITASILAIVSASIEIVSDEISIFGFSVRIEQETLTATAQIVTLVLLVIFLVRVVPEYLQRYRIFSVKKIDIQANAEKASIYEDYYQPDEDYYDGSPAAEIQEVEERFERKKKERETFFDKVALFYDAFADALLNHLFPILLSIIVILNPEIPKAVALAVFAEQTSALEPVDTPYLESILEKQ